MLVFALALLASELGLDLLLGGLRRGPDHPAGARRARDPGVRLQAHRRRVRRLHPVLLRRERHEARRRRAVRQLVGRRRRWSLFFVLFLVVRGTPALLLYRRVLPLQQDRMALALFTVDAAAARRGDHDRRRRRRPHALLHGRRRWSAPAASRRSPARCTACACAASRLSVAPPARLRRASGRSGHDLRHRQAHHEVRAAGRLFRLRIWLSSAMWVPVLAANVLAVGLALGLPILDQHSALGTACRSPIGRCRPSSARSPAA